VLFVDDDIIPEADFIRAHLGAHALGKGWLPAASFNDGKKDWTFPRKGASIALRCNQVKIDDFLGEISRLTDTTKLSHLWI
jgi:hypothetical protein